jgi:glycosyltransferase involved in cell wall biosynthesis
MKILIIAMTDSIHTARWVSQVADQGWEIHIFPSIFGGITHNQLKNNNIHDDFLSFGKRVGINFIALPKLFLALPDLVLAGFNFKKFHQLRLIKLIKRLKPNIVHTLEFQTSGYLMLDAEKSVKKKSFKWIATNWGSDIYYFGRFPEHEKKIKEILSLCDYYSCECQRDVALARQFGFRGQILPVFPNAGGFDLAKIRHLNKVKTSARKIIALKGYQGWAGRSLVGLKALEKCRDLLGGYEVVLYSVGSNPEVISAVETFRKKTNISATILPNKISHEEILSLHGHARISIGLSISDAISTSLLEAMVMGSFPIQSSTACADEWVIDGKTGILVLPEDVDGIERAIRKALTDDKLVDTAAIENAETAKKRLDHQFLKEKAVQFYKDVYSEAR